MAETASRLTATARRWTAERGLAGFTVEELCQEEMISRRTFFNHFATKEDAVLGVSVRDPLQPQQGTLGPAGPPGANGLSASLVDDLADLLVTRYERIELGAADLADLITAIDREPRLLGRARHLSRLQEREDAALVERREHLAPGDPRASTVVQMLGTVLRGAMRDSVHAGGSEPLRALFERRLATARLVLSR